MLPSLFINPWSSQVIASAVFLFIMTMTLAAPVSEQQSSTSLEDDAVEWLLSVPGVLIPLPLFDYMRLEWTPLAIKPDVQMFCVGTPSEG